MKRKLLAIGIVLVLAMSVTLVAMATETTEQGDRHGTGIIEFRDDRGESITVDPPGPQPPPIDPPVDPPSGAGWADLMGHSLNFWSHDVGPIYNLIEGGQPIEFNSVRNRNAAWDLQSPQDLDLNDANNSSHTAVIVRSVYNEISVVNVQMTGFYRANDGQTLSLSGSSVENGTHVLIGHEMDLVRNLLLETVADAGNGFRTGVRTDENQRIRLSANSDTSQGGQIGDLGPAATVAQDIGPHVHVGARYEAVLSTTPQLVTQAPLGKAQAFIVWSIVFTAS